MRLQVRPGFLVLAMACAALGRSDPLATDLASLVTDCIEDVRYLSGDAGAA
ncbi:MAG: hypothetical protein ABFS30_16095 [Pseudomonadota bacterium]